MPKRIDVAALPESTGAAYPSPFDEPCLGRARKSIGDAAGLTMFGVNQLRLPPGNWSSQRHWHEHADELVYVLSGEVVLVTDEGEETLRTGDAAGFKSGEPDGHHFQNRTDTDAILLEIGTRFDDDVGNYSDIDMIAHADENPAPYTYRDGTPYPKT